MEIIYVSPLNDEQEQNALQAARELLTAEVKSPSIEVWICVEREGDIVILLHRHPKSGEKEFHEEGLRIADIFSRFGWVSHTHWTNVAKKLADKGREPG